MAKPCADHDNLTSRFHIRQMRKNHEADERKVLELVQRCYRTAEGWTHEASIISGQRITPEVLRKKLESPTSSILVAEEEGSENIIGCVKVALTTETVAGPLGEEMGYFGMISVAPEFQSQGLGSYLQSEAELECRRRGVSKMVSPQFSCSQTFLPVCVGLC